MAFAVACVLSPPDRVNAAAAIRGSSRKPLSAPVKHSLLASSFLQKKAGFSARQHQVSFGAPPERWLIKCKDVGREDFGANEDVPPEEKYPIPESAIDWNAEWKKFVEGGAVSKAKVPEPRKNSAPFSPAFPLSPNIPRRPLAPNLPPLHGESGIRLPPALRRIQDGVSSRFRRSFGGRPSNTAILLLGGILAISFWFAFLDQASRVPPGAGVL